MSDSKYSSVLRKFLLAAVGYVGGGRVVDEMAELTRTESFSRDQLLEYQFDKFRRLVDHAYRNVPYYRRRMQEAGVEPADFRGPDDIVRFPLSTKQEIRENQNELRATGSDRPMKLVKSQTGGTTGLPLKFVRKDRKSVV